MENNQANQQANQQAIIDWWQNLSQTGQSVFEQWQQQFMPPELAESLRNLVDESQWLALNQQALERHVQLWQSYLNGEPPQAVKKDKRFASPSWTDSQMHDYLSQAYQINAAYFQELADKVPEHPGKHKSRLQFLIRQYVDAMAPSNFAALNPEVIQEAIDSKGESISRGIQNMLVDMEKGRVSMTDDSVLELGRDIATTEGAVVFQNEVMQLLHYKPLTAKVYDTPLLFVPPCINKYYILDLQPDNSMVRFALENGIQVFLISWKNPQVEDSHLSWDHYVADGVLQALDITREITGVKQANVLGFCVGGTLLTSALAVACARGEDPARSVTLMTALLDFSIAGELGDMVDENLVLYRETSIGKGGLLPGQELANVFASLRANDLIWQYVVNNYLKGGSHGVFDLLHWNSDTTNLPGPFLSWYLRNAYLENNLRTPNRLKVAGEKISFTSIDAPCYILATREDHIVPWRGSYLSRALLGGETRFVLGASGHIAGAINPASKNRRSYWKNSTKKEVSLDADAWLENATEYPGTWWVDWLAWLQAKSGTQKVARKTLGNAKYKIIEAAPGAYVKQKA